ncbi:MAG: site-specific integrase [Anaerolineae bacterium]|nr:site-specific integrase [Anaerolineae bacterium]
MSEHKETQTGLAALSSSSTLLQASQVFELYMQNESYSPHTVKAFGNDLKLLGSHIGHNHPIGRISTQDLNAFLEWLRHERGVPCSPKSYARRVTTLKVFFKWLHKSGVLPEDPATPVIQHSVEPPLPQVLGEQDLQKAFVVTQSMWAAAKSDPRPHLLLKLLLETAIKKAECMEIQLRHIRRDTPDGPVLEIRYDDPRKQTKERRLPLSEEIISVLDDYIEAYSPADVLFPCTARNLEYVLTDVAEQAGVKKGVSFEMLRWTAIVRDYVNGVEETRLRQKLGISPITWQSTGKKVKTLAENYQ